MLQKLFFFIGCIMALPVATIGYPGIQFIENKGQWPEGIYYGADVPGGNFYLSDHGFSFLFYDTDYINHRHHNLGDVQKQVINGLGTSEANPYLLQMHLYHAEFVNSNICEILPSSKLTTRFNYMLGSNQSEWVSNAQAFNELMLHDLYDHIDLRLTTNDAALKYDLIVAAGGNVNDIGINYRGVKDIYLHGGDLRIATSFNTITEHRPYAYQIINGEKVEVPCEYQLKGKVLSFKFPMGYDECHELVIDPLLIFSTYSGSAADNWGNTATFGERGKLYSGGITNHFRNGEFLGEFPATAGAFQTEWGGNWDVAILKYDSAGTNVEYATYLGGSGSEVPVSLIMNNKEELIIYGVTNSTDFPLGANAYQSVFQGGTSINTILGETFNNGSDSFVAILSRDGSQLVSSTYFGGNGNDGLNERFGELTRNYGDEQRGEVFIDDNDAIYIAGSTASTNLYDDLTIPSFNRNYGGGRSDAYLTKFNSELTEVVWGGYLGGSSTDTGFAVKVDSKSDVFVAGGTLSTDFSMPADSATIYHGGIEGWVARINQDSLQVNTGAFLGTSAYDQVYLMDLDSEDNVYLLGQTRGAYPIQGNVFSNVGGGQFIHKLSNDLKSTYFSTTFGTTNRFEPNISPTAFLVNDCNNLYVAGWGNTQSNFRGFNYVALNTSGLPTSNDALRGSTTGDDFYLMVLDAGASTLLFGTFFGGNEALVHVDGGTSRFDKSGIVYHSVCASCVGGSSFPTTENAWSRTNGTGNLGCNNAAFKFDLASLRAVIQTNNTSLSQPGLQEVCLPDSMVFQNFSIGGERFEWSFGDGNNVVRTDTAFIAYQFDQAGRYRVTLKAIDPNTCIAEDETSVIVDIFDPQLEAGSDGLICEGNNFRLTASGGTRYQWVSADSTFTSNEALPVVSPSVNTRYFVRIEDANCQKIDTLDVTVIPSTAFDYRVERLFDCFSRPAVRLVNNSADTTSFTWDLGDGNFSDERDFVHHYEEDGTYQIRLINNKDFCVFEQEVTVEITTIKVPNVFTPSDGAPNETFEVVSTGREVVHIYNRWGNLVYESDDYRDDWTASEVPSGVYYYEVEIVDQTTCRGWVRVLK
ncbi:MAG: PKD domain-containing protein [Fulvivirga sp.]|nr:PKD domain-containing protein [Fulvivirga sp.]